MSIPASTACIHSSSVIAGPWAKFLVPFMTLRSITPLGLASELIPISTGIISVWAAFAIRHTELSLLPIQPATAAVTSCPDCDTPSSTMPLSAHIIMTARFLMSISSESWMAPIRAVISSNRPRLSRGLAIESHLERISSYLLLLNGSICIKSLPPVAFQKSSPYQDAISVYLQDGQTPSL